MPFNRECTNHLGHLTIIAIGAAEGAYPGYLLGFEVVREEGKFIGNALIMLSIMGLSVALNYCFFTALCKTFCATEKRPETASRNNPDSFALSITTKDHKPQMRTSQEIARNATHTMRP